MTSNSKISRSTPREGAPRHACSVLDLPMAQNFAITCECGQSIRVIASNAGLAIPCMCGRTAQVPKLSSLKNSAATAASEPSERAFRPDADAGRRRSKGLILFTLAILANFLECQAEERGGVTGAGALEWAIVGVIILALYATGTGLFISSRGYSKWIGVFLGLFFGPLGLVICLLLPRRERSMMKGHGPDFSTLPKLPPLK